MSDENTITTTELEALTQAFSDWRWGSDSLEPDARIDVLFDPNNGDIDHDTPFLVRDGGHWVWTNGPGRSSSEPRTWEGIQHYLRVADDKLRIPTADELRAGGWTITEAPETVNEEQETLPLAAAALLNARDLLERDDNEIPTQAQINEATALALTSIAATMHDLSVLLEDEFAWRRSQRPAQGDETEEDADEDDSAHRSMGPGEDPHFSFSGR